MRYVWDTEKNTFVPWDEFYRDRKPKLEVITDTHEPFKSMGDGKIYDSKSKYRRSLREQGLVELGSDAPDPVPREHEPRSYAEDIKAAIEGPKSAPKFFEDVLRSIR